ncbi:MAG TPA: flagellar export protein FliJ [Cellvibrionaceae bacterium]
MGRAERLQPVLHLADKQLKEAASQLDAVRDHIQQEEQKLKDLEQYYSDYTENFSQHPANTAQALVRQRSFLQQLSQARTQQQQVIGKYRQILTQKQKIWQKAYLKQQAIAQLIERLKKDEFMALSKKEEKRLDEWSAQAHSRKLSANNNSLTAK